MTHCGFGGTGEFINAAVPVLCFPHFADQPINAKQLIDAGAALMLYENKTKSLEAAKTATVLNPAFDEEKICTLFKEIVENPKYKTNMIKLRAQSGMSGGSDLVVRTIEQTYISGTDFLIDREMNRKVSKASCCQAFYCFCSFVAIIIALIYFTV